MILNKYTHKSNKKLREREKLIASGVLVLCELQLNANLRAKSAFV